MTSTYSAPIEYCPNAAPDDDGLAQATVAHRRMTDGLGWRFLQWRWIMSHLLRRFFTCLLVLGATAPLACGADGVLQSDLIVACLPRSDAGIDRVQQLSDSLNVAVPGVRGTALPEGVDYISPRFSSGSLEVHMYSDATARQRSVVIRRLNTVNDVMLFPTVEQCAAT